MPTTNGSYVSEEKTYYYYFFNLFMQKLGVDEMT